MDPLLPRVPHHQRAQCKSKRHREPHISQVKHRRMDHHLRVLQQRIQSESVQRHRPRLNRKRRSRKRQQQQKEHLDPGQNRSRERTQPNVHTVPHPQDKSIRAQQPRPQQQGTFLSAPERRKLVRRIQLTIRMVQDVRHRVIIRKRSPHQCKRRTSQRRKTRQTRPPRRLTQPAGSTIQTICPCRSRPI